MSSSMQGRSEAPPSIPRRTSSKRRAAEPIEQLESNKQLLAGAVKESRKRLNEHKSYDTAYWLDREKIAEQLLDQNRLQKKISKISFTTTDGKDKDIWNETAEAKEFVETDAILTLDKKLFREQASRLNHLPEPVTRATRKLFMEWFTKLPLGLGATEGRRDTKLQSRFKQELVKAYGTAHPEPGKTDMWCPVLGKYVGKHGIKAAHIFGYALGQDLMTEIFEDEEGERDELFSPKNGMIMHTEAEARFDKGFIVFVPSVDDESAEAVKAWHESESKAYKIRVLDTKVSKMKEFVPGVEERRRWTDLEVRN